MEGLYYDPKHGGGLRTVVRTETKRWWIRGNGEEKYIIRGVYGSDEAPHTGKVWSAVARKKSGETRYVVDFAGKPIKKDRHLLCWREGEDGVRWQDGNLWKRMRFHPRQLDTLPLATTTSATIQGLSS